MSNPEEAVLQAPETSSEVADAINTINTEPQPLPANVASEYSLSKLLVAHGFINVTGEKTAKGDIIKKATSKTGTWNEHEQDVVVIDHSGNVWMARLNASDSIMPGVIACKLRQRKMHVPDLRFNLKKIIMNP